MDKLLNSEKIFNLYFLYGFPNSINKLYLFCKEKGICAVLDLRNSMGIDKDFFRILITEWYQLQPVEYEKAIQYIKPRIKRKGKIRDILLDLLKAKKSVVAVVDKKDLNYFKRTTFKYFLNKLPSIRFKFIKASKNE